MEKGKKQRRDNEKDKARRGKKSVPLKLQSGTREHKNAGLIAHRHFPIPTREERGEGCQPLNKDHVQVAATSDAKGSAD